MLVNWWHSKLDMKRYDQAWHESDMADELAEYHEETRWLKKWSELSDVAYTYGRSLWDGCSVDFPLPKALYPLGLMYMFPKYTGRWLFFRRAGKKAGAKKAVHEVRNPQKVHKLHTIAERNDIDPVVFTEICQKQLRHWILLP